ncbi:B-cell lymphoma/leukemia 11B-like [Amblyraja radiata]|uniref:B-cell lymphoma/leukemia 11B-like n=1 Tax=Amblyraja radiata TaxID=386614 RepID=UPI00140243D6|nr:B-cell lymphoma/leukemia 11B-like [Amblyraja radiata]
MSRRKQGSKPQHRSELSREDEKLEDGQGSEVTMPPGRDPATPDLLTCGQCGLSLPLRHILHFIQHKRSDCSRPRRSRNSPGPPHSPPPTPGLRVGQGARSGEGHDDGTPVGDEMEPSCYICTSCKEPFSSAWDLLQHAQYHHGLHIFLEIDPCESPPILSAEDHHRHHHPSSPPRDEGAHFPVPRHPGTPFFAPPPHGGPEQSDSGSEDTGPSGRGLPDFSRRLRTLAGGPGRGGGGGAHQRSLHGRSKDCEFCGKTFKFPSNLVVHRRSHTGEKPYRCPLCEHACSQSSKLKRHMKTHAGLFNGWPLTSATRANLKGPAPHRRRYAGGQQDTSASPAITSQEEMGLKVKGLKVEPDVEEEQQPEEATETSDCEGNESDRLHDNGEAERPGSSPGAPGLANGEAEGPCSSPRAPSLANGEAERPGSSLRAPVLANGFGRHVKRPLGPPPARGPIKAEPGPTPDEAGPNFYSRWLADCAASRGLPLAPPSSSSPAPRASPASENGGSCSSTPPRDVSADSGTASGHSTPKRPAGEEGRWAGGPRQGPGSGPGLGRRRNSCEFCGKVFRNASNLTVHRRSHTGERPYRCQLCAYACTQSSKLTRHMKTHVQPGREVYRCHTCDIPFSIYSTLEKHIKKRHSQAPATQETPLTS